MRPAQVSVDCLDPFALADWWRDALGWRDVWRTEVRRHAIIAPDDGSGWQLCFIAVPDPTPGNTTARDSATTAGSSVTCTRAPTCSNALAILRIFPAL